MTVHPAPAAFAPHAIACITWRPDGMAWSPGVYRLLGLPETGFTPSLDLLMSFVLPEERSVRQDLVELAQGRRLDQIAFRIARRDGRIAVLAATRLEQAEGTGNEPRLCLLDGTEEEGREREAEAARHLLLAVLARVADGVVLVSREGVAKQANGRAAEILATDPLEGASVWDRFPGLSADPIGRFVLGGDEGRATDERWVPALNRWLCYDLVRIGPDCLFVFRDRGEVAGLRASLHETCGRWASAVAGAGALLFEADSSGDRIWLTGEGTLDTRSPERRDCTDEIADADRARLKAALRGAALGGEPVALDLRTGNGDGSGRILRVRAGAAEIGGERPGRIAGLAFDPAHCARDEAEDAPGPARFVTGGQVRAARGALRWSVRELAEQSDVSVATINRFEAGSRTVSARDRNVAALQTSLTSRGIAFFWHGDRPALAIGPEVPV